MIRADRQVRIGDVAVATGHTYRLGGITMHDHMLFQKVSTTLFPRDLNPEQKMTRMDLL
jgi:hypothetical protein